MKHQPVARGVPEANANARGRSQNVSDDNTISQDNDWWRRRVLDFARHSCSVRARRYHTQRVLLSIKMLYTVIQLYYNNRRTHLL
jgi:hypothetical protein